MPIDPKLWKLDAIEEPLKPPYVELASGTRIAIGESAAQNYIDADRELRARDWAVFDDLAIVRTDQIAAVVVATPGVGPRPEGVPTAAGGDKKDVRVPASGAGP